MVNFVSKVAHLYASDSGRPQDDLVVGACKCDQLLGVPLRDALRDDGNRTDGGLLQRLHRRVGGAERGLGEGERKGNVTEERRRKAMGVGSEGLGDGWVVMDWSGGSMGRGDRLFHRKISLSDITTGILPRRLRMRSVVVTCWPCVRVLDVLLASSCACKATSK